MDYSIRVKSDESPLEKSYLLDLALRSSTKPSKYNY